jgi:hypothetical protein
MLPGLARSVRSWQHNRDAAWTNIARGIKEAVSEADASGLWPHSETTGRANMGKGMPHNNFFDVAAAGDTTVLAADEPEFAVRSVQQCKHTMRTISYREEDWWSVHSRGLVSRCQASAGSGGSQGFPSMAPRIASSGVVPWAAAESR